MIERDFSFEKLKKYSKNILKKEIYSDENIKGFDCGPFCGHKHFIKYGKYQGIQRYKCNNKMCGKTFSNTTNSIWKYLKHDPEKWFKYIELMGEDRTLAYCAEKLRISVVTAFNWRHKIMHGIENNYQPNVLKELAFMKILITKRNYKGSRNKRFHYENSFFKRYGIGDHDVCTIFMSDSNNIPAIKTTVPAGKWKDTFNENYLSIMDVNTYIHIDNKFRKLIFEHIADYNKKLPLRVRKKYDFQISNYYIKDNVLEGDRKEKFIQKLISWLEKFNGVATKYINHYCNFYCLKYVVKVYDYMKIFHDLLLNGVYCSIQAIRNTHLENY